MKKPVSEMFCKYIERKDLRASSIEVYQRAARYFVAAFGDMDVRDVSYVHADDFRVLIKKGRTPGTANTYLRPMKGFFRATFERHEVDNNPFAKVKLYRVGVRKKEVYTPDEITRLLSVAGLRWQVIILLALQGLREGEILNLTVADIDFEKNLISIVAKKDTAATWLWEIKDYDVAIVGMPSVVANRITRLLDLLAPGQPYICVPPDYYRGLMERKAAGTMPHRKRNCPWGNFNRDFRRLCRNAGVQYRKFHTIRDTFATERYRQWNGDIKKLQKVMRHSSIQTTALYVQGIEDAELVRDSVAVFEQKYCVT